MRIFFRILAAFAILMAAVTAQASTTAPQNGIDYKTLETPQNTESGKKVEVTEFFWYSCPHCAAFDPQLSEWVKKQGDNIVFKRVHVSFRDSFVPQQKLYYALESMGRADDMNKKIFHAIHVEHNQLDTDATILAFIVKNGIDRQKFLDVYNSFSVLAKVKRADQQQQAYKIDGVPVIAINGKYMTSPSIAAAGMNQAQAMTEVAMQQAALQVMDVLVAKELKDKAPAKAVKKVKK
jgi:thiol:disulfide interchange protein DsbA